MSELLGNIKGQTGATGATGAQGIQGDEGLHISSASIDSNYHLILSMSDLTTIDAGYVKGADGSIIETVIANALTEGSQPTAQFVGNTLTFGIPQGTTGSQGIQGIQGNTGLTGAQGESIVGATIDPSYNLILELSGGGTINAGYVRGAAGADATLLDGDVNGGVWI